MSPEEAADLAARTLTAIDGPRGQVAEARDPATVAADRERVASDLAGLRDIAHVYEAHRMSSLPLDRCEGCRHARRYADGLRLTAALYRVIP